MVVVPAMLRVKSFCTDEGKHGGNPFLGSGLVGGSGKLKKKTEEEKKLKSLSPLLNQGIKCVSSHFPSQASSLCLAARRFCSFASCSFFLSASRCSFVTLLFTPRAPITSLRASDALV